MSRASPSLPLFDTHAPANQRARETPNGSSGGGGFDAYSHPCEVCGKPNAPYGFGWPLEPRFYCKEHSPGRQAQAMRAKGPGTPTDRA
jgi:hypothetical protein